MLKSHSFIWADYNTKWYRRWGKALLQDAAHRENFALHSNKFWQNAAITQALWERGVLTEGKHGLGFGVGQERLPALFASLGVNVTATDQDFEGKKAGHWAKHELAKSLESLNRLAICDPKILQEKVSFRPVDMTNIPADLDGKYDFVWSNCALGHLGSIPKGLDFIEQSLKCLKPGGWATHTTELNILSNDKTVTKGDTVIFRLKDIHTLQQKLIGMGYEVDTLRLTLGKHIQDKRINMLPQFGNDNSKIQVGGHLATQVLLIFHKPKNFDGKRKSEIKPAFTKALKLNRAYKRNLRVIDHYKKSDRLLKQFLESRNASVQNINVQPVRKKVIIKIQKGSSGKVGIEYRNKSTIPLFGVYSEFGAMPIVLATTSPHDRASKFADNTWLARDRPTMNLFIRTKQNTYIKAGHIETGQDFSFDLVLNSNTLQKGIYKEDFCIVQEHVGWVENSTVTVAIEVY